MPPNVAAAAPAAKKTTEAKKSSGKTAAPAAVAPVVSTPAGNPLFPSRPKNWRVGGDIRPKGRDLSRLVKWPRYVRLQRQKKILLQRLTCPPTANQFNKTLVKNQAAETSKLLSKYKPETKAAKQDRLNAKAAAVKDGKAAAPSGPAPVVLKYGLKHVTTLVEQKKAKLVLIAHDVDPLELVVWLPALCRKQDIPYAIVKGKARLGALTDKKTTAVVALTAVNKDDEAKLKTLQENFRAQFNEHPEKRWGGGIMGLKTQAMLLKRRQQLEKEDAKRKDSKK